MSTHQPALFDGFDAPTIAATSRATDERDRILAALARRAGDRFRSNAGAFIVRYLREHGATAGEVITDACKAAGITPPPGLDDRAFGPVYGRLSRAGAIRKVDTVARRKGHGTAGGTVWARGER